MMIARIRRGAVAQADGDAYADYMDEAVSLYDVARSARP